MKSGSACENTQERFLARGLSLMRIKFVIFDLAEVLLRGLLGVEELLSKKLNLPSEEAGSALRGSRLDELFRGKITEEEYLIKILQETNWKISKKELKKVIRKNFTEIPGTRSVIRALKKKYKVVVLSVHAREWIDYCKRQFGLKKLFSDGAFFSFEMKVMKPERKAFIEVLKAMRAHPKKTLFIDDSEVNIRAAQGLGMQTIQFESANQLNKELRRLKLI